ncbi:hypothetical protein CI610_03285 [invertebrate metagenome]|uniref:Uncharacterized protein n=1 Tax=invertebrate metagenome TaxID=1711999 RepID=A0A2H9T3H7_9ZZZZ
MLVFNLECMIFVFILELKVYDVIKRSNYGTETVTEGIIVTDEIVSFYLYFIPGCNMLYIN